MQQIIQYRADDGSGWASAESARRRDDLHAAVTAALAILGPRPTLHSGSYVQHRIARVLAARATFAAVARAYEPTLCGTMPDDWHPNFGPWGAVPNRQRRPARARLDALRLHRRSGERVGLAVSRQQHSDRR